MRLCCPLNDTQGCGPAAGGSCGALAALAEVAAGSRASASRGRAGERVAWGWGAG